MGDTATGPRAVSLRLTAEAAAALDALAAAAGGRVARHRLAVVALEHGARALAADPAALLRALGMGHLLAAVEAVPPPAVAPAAVAPAGGVIHRVAEHDGASRPTTEPRAVAPRHRAVARGDASTAEVDAMVTALRGALDRGASVNAVCMARGGASRPCSAASGRRCRRSSRGRSPRPPTPSGGDAAGSRPRGC